MVNTALTKTVTVTAKGIDEFCLLMNADTNNMSNKNNYYTLSHCATETCHF